MYAIACSILECQKVLDTGGEGYEVIQFRRHDRSLVYAKKARSYYQDGKRVAVNRKRATAQDKKTQSLEEWYREQVSVFGETEARKQLGTLLVKKSKRSYNNPKRVMQGALFRYDGKVYVLKSQKDKGASYKGFGMGSYVPASKCTVIRENCGLVYL